MSEYSLWGGYSYHGGATEEFESVLEAALEYLHRMEVSNTYYPLWGDCSEDDYVVTTEFEGWTLTDLRAIVNEKYHSGV
jgi:hypothetical protein